MKTLITGGAGFIGSHLTKRLLSEGNEVYVVDNLSSGKEENVPKKAFFIQEDITNQEEVEKIFKINFDNVVHLAAIISPGEIKKEPLKHIELNIKAPLNLFKLAKRYGVNKFINTSSMAVYGNPQTPFVNEQSPLTPVSLYGLGKLITEYNSLLMSSNKLNIITTRLFNVYGPGQDIEDTRSGMLRIFLNYVYHNKPISVKGTLERFRDFVYVADVVNAISLILKGSNLKHKVYNVCSGRKTTIRQLLDLIISSFGKDPEHYPIKITRRMRGDIYGVYGDNSRIKAELGWKPEVSLEKGVLKTVKASLR